MKIIDYQNWKRKEHFDFFSNLDDPYWSITTSLDCSSSFLTAKKEKHSFFLSCLHKSLLAANKTEEFKLRTNKSQIELHDKLHASATILREDETFGCCFIEFLEDFSLFSKNAKKEIEITRSRTGMCLEMDIHLNQIHYSSIPWNSFTSITYARNFKPQDSIPKITFGKVTEQNDKYLLPVAIQVHHGLVDGLHVARFLERFQKLL
jgi:chloramphenicol O-acetyltransferase type A